MTNELLIIILTKSGVNKRSIKSINMTWELPKWSFCPSTFSGEEASHQRILSELSLSQDEIWQSHCGRSRHHRGIGRHAQGSSPQPENVSWTPGIWVSLDHLQMLQLHSNIGLHGQAGGFGPGFGLTRNLKFHHTGAWFTRKKTSRKISWKTSWNGILILGHVQTSQLTFQNTSFFVLVNQDWNPSTKNAPFS